MSSPQTNEETEIQRKARELKETLENLEKEYLTSSEKTNEIRKQIFDMRDKLINAQEDSFRKFQEYTNVKEQILIGAINERNAQIQQLAKQLQPPSSKKSSLATIDEVPELVK